MTVEATPGLYSLTKPVVMSHPNLFEARAFGKKGKESGVPKFSANFVFPVDHPDLKPLKQLAAKIARAKWPDRDLKTLSFCFTNGDKLADKRKTAGKEDGEFQRGKVVVAARSRYEPRLAGVENGKPLDYEGPARLAAKGKFYFGVEVLAQVNLVAYDGVGNNPDGVTAYLNMVFTTNKGERLGGGGQSAAEAFRGYIGSTTQEDPTAGAAVDDEIPF